jgi:aminoglycoside 6'-N-acetyltransferase
LRPAGRADQALIRSWLGRPDIEAWWGPKSATEAAVTLAMGAPHAITCIIEADGMAVGYAQAVDATLWGADLPEDLESGTWEIDLFVASELHRGRGVGVAALNMLKQTVFETTFATAVCVFASVSNERAVRAYEKAGFRWKRVLNLPQQGHAWFMVADRPS